MFFIKNINLFTVGYLVLKESNQMQLIWYGALWEYNYNFHIFLKKYVSVVSDDQYQYW